MKLRVAHATVLAAVLVIMLVPIPNNAQRRTAAENESELNALTKLRANHIRDHLGNPRNESSESIPDADSIQLYIPGITLSPHTWGEISVERNREIEPLEFTPSYTDINPMQLLTPYTPGSAELVIEPYSAQGSVMLSRRGVVSGIPVTELPEVKEALKQSK
jgi:hypothetical protein